eukprot:TRINITY_DN1468_c0_g1_i1.p1 TRINITY_DN1468_c0_g1~~TRINITY_DN1468_c0_g1_i1.p1  ORF type:complete len:348 (-),score=51.29 TRINITY_DN1468_c0_g1_i1:86-1129(-)
MERVQLCFVLCAILAALSFIQAKEETVEQKYARVDNIDTDRKTSQYIIEKMGLKWKNFLDWKHKKDIAPRFSQAEQVERLVNHVRAAQALETRKIQSHFEEGYHNMPSHVTRSSRRSFGHLSRRAEIEPEDVNQNNATCDSTPDPLEKAVLFDSEMIADRPMQHTAEFNLVEKIHSHVGFARMGWDSDYYWNMNIGLNNMAANISTYADRHNGDFNAPWLDCFRRKIGCDLDHRVPRFYNQLSSGFVFDSPQWCATRFEILCAQGSNAEEIFDSFYKEQPDILLENDFKSLSLQCIRGSETGRIEYFCTFIFVAFSQIPCAECLCSTDPYQCCTLEFEQANNFPRLS